MSQRSRKKQKSKAVKEKCRRGICSHPKHERIWCTVAGSEMEAPMLKTWRKAPGSWGWHPAASQQRSGTSALQLWRAKFCQWLEWAWKQNSSQSLSIRGIKLTAWWCLHGIQSRETSRTSPDFWPTKPWYN